MINLRFCLILFQFQRQLLTCEAGKQHFGFAVVAGDIYAHRLRIHGRNTPRADGFLPNPTFLCLALTRHALRQNPVTALIGPRQCGKTTLARQLAAQGPHEYFDLEAPSDLERLANPMTTLEPLRGLVVVDEVQRKPDLFPLLRVLSDRRPLPALFLRDNRNRLDQPWLA